VAEHFLPSVSTDFDVVLRRHDQVCPTGTYCSEGWRSATLNKIPLILEAIESEREPFVFSDVDVRFYDFKADDLDREMQSIGGFFPDLRCQSDAGTACSGFMMIRPGPASRELFQLVGQFMRASDVHSDDDQVALNKYALPAMGDRIKASQLSTTRYWNIGPDWDGGDPPPTMLVHHANWVVGVERKMTLLDVVRSKKKLPALLAAIKSQ